MNDKIRINYNQIMIINEMSRMIITLSGIPDLHGGPGGRSRFLTGDLKDRVIFGIKYHVG